MYGSAYFGSEFFGENWQGCLVFTAAFDDTVDITDILTVQFAATATCSDTVGITNALSTGVVVQRGLTDAVEITAVLTNQLALVEAIADVVGITEFLSSGFTITISLTDTVEITDSFSYTSTTNYFTNFDDTVGVDAELSTRLNISLANTVGIAETLATAVGKAVGFTDVVELTAAFTRHLGRVGTLLDQVGITGTLTISSNTSVSLVDSVGIDATFTVIFLLDHDKLVQPLSVVVMVDGRTVAILSESGVTTVDIVPQPGDVVVNNSTPLRVLVNAG